MFWKIPASLAFLLLLAPLARTEQGKKVDDKPTPGDAMIYKYLCAESDKLSAKVFDGAKLAEEWQKKRPRLYQEYMDMLGLWPIPEKTPLKTTITGSLEHEGVIIDKLHFQSKPGLYVTGNLYRPKEKPAKPLPAIVYVCGHAFRGRDGNKSAHQDHGMWFASNGYICIVLDTLQLGEIPGVHHGTYGTPYRHFKGYGLPGQDTVENRWWWHSAGYTPAGVECWNGIRAIDYLVTRPDVDKDRIGVTGISGGGAATFWIAAADERVKVAVPVSGMADLESYVKNKVINGHCDCMFLYNTYQWDWTTIACMIAPRPMLFANSDNDSIFPMDGNRRVIEKLRKLYKMHGKPDLVDEYVSKGGHAYRPDLRVAIFKFINKHLKNDTTSVVKDAIFKELPGKELRVFPTEADIPKDALNGKIDETFVPKAKVALPEKGKFEAWKKDLLQKLRTTCFRSFPDQIAVPKEVMNLGGVSVQLATEPGIELWRAFRLFNNNESNEKAPLVVLGSNPADDPNPKWEEHVPHTSGVGFAPRGVIGKWTIKSPPNYVERSHALLGMTVDQRRLLDVRAWLMWETAEFEKGAKINLCGHREAGILAAYAAIFKPDHIKGVFIIDPPRSHMEGPHFPGVLRVLDIPEALGLLAPTPLTLVNAPDSLYDRVAEIYRLAGAADKLKRK